MKQDSKLWAEAYESYKKHSPPKPIKLKKRKNVQVPHRTNWLQTHKAMLEWQKTEEFTKWRRRQFLKQGGTCYYCDEPLIGSRQNIEHITPKSKGGTNSRKNLVITCSRCNKDKGTSLLTKNQRDALKAKNLKKRGTYHVLQETYKTEEQIAYELKEMFME
jgi:5-methylcytosine-specific restriction endonuclease McrA